MLCCRYFGKEKLLEQKNLKYQTTCHIFEKNITDVKITEGNFKEASETATGNSELLSLLTGTSTKWCDLSIK